MNEMKSKKKEELKILCNLKKMSWKLKEENEERKQSIESN